MTAVNINSIFAVPIWLLLIIVIMIVIIIIKINYKVVKALGRITVWIVHASIVVMVLFIFSYFSIAVIRHHNQNK